VPKNYHQARKQKELARKARQHAKEQRRSARLSAAGESEPPTAVEGSVVPRNPTSGSGS
jgi:hypothetical protein